MNIANESHDSHANRVLITAALPYANGTIHFGHLAGAYLPADCYARFKRLTGSDVCFICGSDEYGVAIVLSSQMQGRTPQEQVDLYHQCNKNLFEKLGVSFDHFSRTTADIHTQTAQEFFQMLYKKGFVTEMESEQLYCEEDGQFYADRYVVGVCPKCGFSEARGDECTKCGASFEAIELKNPKTKLSGRALFPKKTTHWYLRLDLMKEELLTWIESRESWKPNVLQFIKNYIADLKPRAITRDMSWGIPVPLPEAVGKVLYVWFDAPIGYISATKEWALEKKKDPDLWKKFWFEPDTKMVQFIGKDNIPFHAVIFPAMIMGHDLPFKLVDDLPANEFYTLEGKQFSKSDGWYIDLPQFLERYDAELLRYCIAANAPETQDSEFSWKEFQNRVNVDLVGKFGNFIHRSLVFIKNNYNSHVPESGTFSPVDHEFLSAIYEKIEAIREAYSGFRLRRATQLIMEMAQLGNVYFDAKKPWIKSVSDPTVLSQRDTTVTLCLECIKLLGLAIRPIMPRASSTIDALLGLTVEETKAFSEWDAVIRYKMQPGATLMNTPQPLFQKIEESVILLEEAALHGKEAVQTAQKEPLAIEKEAIIAPSSEITLNEFDAVQLEVVEILEAEAVVKSKKLLKLQVQSKSGRRQILSGIAQHYKPEELIGKKVVACVNLKPAKLMGLESHGMILAASSSDGKLEVVEMHQSSAGDSVR